jgi:hypothetical protein
MVVIGTGLDPRIIRWLVVVGMTVREFGFVKFLEKGWARRRVVVVGWMIVVRPGRIYGDCMVIMGVSKNITDRGVKMLVDGIMKVVARRGCTWSRRVRVRSVTVKSEWVHWKTMKGTGRWIEANLRFELNNRLHRVHFPF